jgi:hypothetical protein
VKVLLSNVIEEALGGEQWMLEYTTIWTESEEFFRLISREKCATCRELISLLHSPGLGIGYRGENRLVPSIERVRSMFIGHYAVALAAKKAAPKTSLGTLFLAAQFVDLLWPLLMLLGLEHARIDPGNTAFTPMDFYDYPISHSLLGGCVWSLVVGLVYYMTRKYKQGGLVVGLCVLSHWLLDFLTHRPDLPLGFLGPRVGLGLWNSVIGTLIVEGVLFVAGLTLYLSVTETKDRLGLFGFWSLVVVLVIIYLSSSFGPPPPSTEIVAIVGNASWLFVFWAFWADKHRQIRS